MTLDPRVLRGLGSVATAESPKVHARLAEARIALSVGNGPCALAISEIAADQLVRLFPQIVAGDGRSGQVVTEAIAWAGTEASCVGGEADVAIVIGDGPSVEAESTVFVGANRWRAHVSSTTPQITGSIGLGAAAAGYLAVLEAFKRMFSTWIEGPLELLSELHWSLFDWSIEGDSDGPDLRSLELPELVWAGTGAISHGAFAGLAILPNVSGRIIAIDPDEYGPSSARRYPRARSEWNGEPKSGCIRDWLQAVQPGLEVVDFATDLNRWYETSRPECVVPILVTAPDSKEARRHAALKLPRISINGWAERFRIGVETFPFQPGRCLGCAYPIDAEAVSELEVFRQETGLQPWRVQSLLDDAGPLSDEDIVAVAAKHGLAPDELRGRTIRSLREHLCAVGRVTPPGDSEALDVPLGFVSGLAGVAMLAEVVRFVLTSPTGKRWEWDARLTPAPGNAWLHGPRPDCFVCGDADFVAVYNEKYGI
jgi:hypothetical protein